MAGKRSTLLQDLELSKSMKVGESSRVIREYDTLQLETMINGLSCSS